ncbi:hypothetical protein Tco_0951298 [Tanacetum coccineum]|uniref:Uncharacterized protein n=1 Tax=Tanacetum coccineum TaxID=301880 RepID=A0ABQ5DWG7_9ASTR
METPEDDLVANVGRSGNAQEMEAKIKNQNMLSLDTINGTPKENLGLNSKNNKDGDNSKFNMGMIVNKGTNTNLDEGVKEIEKDNSRSLNDDAKRTISQILVNLQRQTRDKETMVGGSEHELNKLHTLMLGNT